MDQPRKRSIEDVQASRSASRSASAEVVGECRAGRPSFDATHLGLHTAGAATTAAVVPPKVRRTLAAKRKSAETATGISPEKPKKAAASTKKRPKRYRAQPPRTVAERLDCAKSQRMYVLSRSGQQTEAEGEGPSETFTITGSMGNVYTVRICAVSSCNCPDGRKSGTCKHILYVMYKVLKAPANLVYQAGLLSGELDTIFAHAPRPGTGKSSRKPLQENGCPICFCLFDGRENIVWCKAQCGTNIHEVCFDRWKETNGQEGATCVLCRQPWQEGSAEAVAEAVTEAFTETLGEEGDEVGSDEYINAADELDIGGVRGYASYNPWFTGEVQNLWGYDGYYGGNHH
jgi:hypothetical protein